MKNKIAVNIARFILLVLLQVLVFNNIQVFNYLTPYIYILFIIILPFETPKWLLLLSGFVLGYTVDIFSGTGGIHAAASTFAAFLRPWFQNLAPAKQEFEPGMEPCIRMLGFKWFFVYSLLLTTAHHIMFYFLEVFRLSNFLKTMQYALINVVFTMIFIILIQYLFPGKKR